MRYSQLIEANEFDTPSPDQVIEFIKTNCQPYLKENPKLIPFYRGIRMDNDLIIVKSVRQNRNPLSSGMGMHNIFNKAFEDSGFKATRDNSIFVTPNKNQSHIYGTVYIVFPIGEFSYTYSNKVKDLLFSYSDIIKQLGIKHISPVIKNRMQEIAKTLDISDISDYTMFLLKEISENLYGKNYEIFAHPDKVKVNWEKLPELLKDWYTDSNLVQAEKEVMISCEKVLLVREDFYRNYLVGKIV